MVLIKYLGIALLLCAAAYAKDESSVVTGKWTCTAAESDAGTKWTLVVREDGAKLGGTLTNGEIDLPISDAKLEGTSFKFRFSIEANTFVFEGKVDGAKLEGSYSGEAASGRTKCVKPAA